MYLHVPISHTTRSALLSVGWILAYVNKGSPSCAFGQLVLWLYLMVLFVCRWYQCLFHRYKSFLLRWGHSLSVFITLSFEMLLTFRHYFFLQQSQSFFKLLSMLTELQGGPPGLPSFTNLTLARIWEVCRSYLVIKPQNTQSPLPGPSLLPHPSPVELYIHQMLCFRLLSTTLCYVLIG